MPKVILFIATSLDGYIAGPAGEIDWLFHDADYGYTAFFDSVEVLVMGRKTYDLCLSFEAWPYGDKPAFVFTRQALPEDARVSFVTGDATGLITGLRARATKDIWLVGGAELVSTFLHEGLVDEFVISIHPILLGAGIPLFASGSPCHGLKLVQATPFASGLVQLRYTTEIGPGHPSLEH